MASKLWRLSSPNMRVMYIMLNIRCSSLTVTAIPGPLLPK